MRFYEIVEKALALERAGKKIVRLNIGDTNLPTPECAIQTAITCMQSEKCTYGNAAGLPALREKIATRENCSIDEVLVGPGSKYLLFALMSVLLKKNDKLLLPVPAWPAYFLMAKHFGVEVVMQRTEAAYKWGFGALALKDINMLMICNPLNPTSTVYDTEVLKKTITECQQKGIPVILDEAYKGIAFDALPIFEGAIRVRSFSKEFNLEGWRLGYVVAPKELIEQLAAFNRINATSVASFVQKAGLACLNNEKQLIKSHVGIWKNRLATAHKALAKLGFSFVDAAAGMYLFASHPKLKDSVDFALELLDAGVAVAPGADFGGYNNYIRICANQDESVFEEAVELLSKKL